jgi:hypothetical protein
VTQMHSARDQQLLTSIQQAIKGAMQQVPPQYRLMAPAIEALAMGQVESACPHDLRAFLIWARSTIDNLLHYGTLDGSGDLLGEAWLDPIAGRETQRLPGVDDLEAILDALEVEADPDRRGDLSHAASVVAAYLQNEQGGGSAGATAPAELQAA